MEGTLKPRNRRSRQAPALVVALLTAWWILFLVVAACSWGGTDPTGPTRQRAWLARVVVDTEARQAPGRGRRVASVPVRAPWNGGPVELLVLGSRRAPDGARWVRVLLPRRPNGSSGWIRADDVALSTTEWRIEVSLGRRLVTVRREGRVWRRFRAVVGAPRTPTPIGTFAVSERVRQPNPRGFPGSWILFLTAFSNRLERFDGNDGQVGIHGRGGASLRDPLGSARSNGCVRVTNAVVSLLAARAREGTPVVIAP
jgi:hypothetical protein